MEFNPPPVFQYAGNGNPNPNNLPFKSFDIGSDAEPPLLEELGINTNQIYEKTISILNPIRVKADLHEDADLSGPFLLLMAFGLFQLLAGKLHFRIILGWTTVASLFLYTAFNMLARRNGNLGLHRCASLIGYSMIPVVISSAISLFLPRGILIMAVCGIFALWSARVCTKLASYGYGEHSRLIAYACFLIYALFSLLVMF